VLATMDEDLAAPVHSPDTIEPIAARGRERLDKLDALVSGLWS
jgi:hypothetical protein